MPDQSTPIPDEASKLAIAQCEKWIIRHSVIARREALYFFALFALLVGGVFFVVAEKVPRDLQFWPYVASGILFGSLLFFGGVQYRVHVKEIVRNGKRIFGLMRIEIAATNANIEGYKTEVRASLTSGAFNCESDDSFRGRSKEAAEISAAHPAFGVLHKT